MSEPWIDDPGRRETVKMAGSGWCTEVMFGEIWERFEANEAAIAQRDGRIAELEATVERANRFSVLNAEAEAALTAEVERLRAALTWYSTECAMPDTAIAALAGPGSEGANG